MLRKGKRVMNVDADESFLMIDVNKVHLFSNLVSKQMASTS
jgi:hypothetical protein